MSALTVTSKTFLEAVLGMSDGYVLDFSNTSFAQFFDDLGIDIYEEQFAEYGVSKANRLRSLWKHGSDAEIASVLSALAEYVEAKQAAGGFENVTVEQITKIRAIAASSGGPSAPAPVVPVAITTEATVTNNLISIEIHEDIYDHIQQYLATEDYFHAVEESYKIVREKLRELTRSERATDAFNENAQSKKHYSAMFGKEAAVTPAEADFFRGVGYLHLGVQFLRNEKAHTLATFVEPNLAVHYISLASLAYDLITRYVNDETIVEIEALVLEKRRGYRSATRFYREFEHGKWLESMHLPAAMKSSSVRRVLKDKWLTEADFTINFDHSNVILMRLELVMDQLTQSDLEHLLDLPTKDTYGNDQEAGMWSFLEFMQEVRPDLLSTKAIDWIEQKKAAGQ